jgi:hypothetical protein
VLGGAATPERVPLLDTGFGNLNDRSDPAPAPARPFLARRPAI